MRSEPSPQLRLVQSPSSGTLEHTLLELFAPTRAFERFDQHGSRADAAALWRADAIHRARNLAQLASSLANVAEYRNGWLSHHAVSDARALARAYEELGHDDGVTATVPCASLLSEIASRLVLLFGRERSVATCTTAHTLALAPDRRRALVLICSELVINALKYGFSTDGGGTIAIRLEGVPGHGVLIVEDDGAGDVALHVPGHGSALLHDLVDVLGATIVREPAAGRRGYRVTVAFALADVEQAP